MDLNVDVELEKMALKNENPTDRCDFFLFFFRAICDPLFNVIV